MYIWLFFPLFLCVSIIKKIPDKWVEDWPEEKSISIENPYFGELNFPGEILENKDQTLPKEKKPAPSPLPNPAPNKVEAKTVTPPVPVVPKEKKKLSVETEEDEMLRKLEEPSP